MPKCPEKKNHSGPANLLNLFNRQYHDLVVFDRYYSREPESEKAREPSLPKVLELWSQEDD